MIKSMTGFGRAEVQDAERKFTVEIKSVNHRYLDFNIRMPKKLSFFENAIRSLLKTYMLRGKVDVFISYEDYTQSDMVLQYKKEIAAQYVQYFKQMAEDFQLENDLTVSQLGRCPEVFAMEESTVDCQRKAERGRKSVPGSEWKAGQYDGKSEAGGRALPSDFAGISQQTGR